MSDSQFPRAWTSVGGVLAAVVWLGLGTSASRLGLLG